MPWDSLRVRTGTSPKQEISPNSIWSSNGLYKGFVRNGIHENGYGTNDREVGHCQYEHNSHKSHYNSEASVALAESFSKASESRPCDGPKRAQGSNMAGNSHSEVTRVVPLKPQRSKKSLNKDNKATVNPETESWSDRSVCGAAVDAHRENSKDGSCETARIADGCTSLQSVSGVKENPAAIKDHSEAAASYRPLTQPQFKKELSDQKEHRDLGQSQCSRGSATNEDFIQHKTEFKDYVPSKVPTAPPRSLPLKTQWSREWPSHVDSSHIHHRTPSQDTSSRKHAVNHLPLNLSVSHRKVKHCMSFKRCLPTLFFFFKSSI